MDDPSRWQEYSSISGTSQSSLIKPIPRNTCRSNVTMNQIHTMQHLHSRCYVAYLYEGALIIKPRIQVLKSYKFYVVKVLVVCLDIGKGISIFLRRTNHASTEKSQW